MNKNYKLKKDSCWESVKATYEGYNTSDILFEDDFEEATDLPKFNFGDRVVGKNGDIFHIDCIREHGNIFIYTGDETDIFHKEQDLKNR